MRHFRPTSHRIAVFHVRHRAKTASGILYRPKGHDDTLWGAQEVWVYKCGPDCSPQFKPGTKLLIPDGSAMIEDAPNTWELVQDSSDFKDLKEIVDRLECQVQTKLIFEGAAIAIDIED